MKKRSLLWILTGCALSACAQTVASVGFTSAPLNTRTEGKPVAVTSARTPAPTRTPTATATSTVTPTSGPPPDLELNNVSIYPDNFSDGDQLFTLLGRIRNNTKQTMLLHGPDAPFYFNFEVWIYYPYRVMIDNKPFGHSKYNDKAYVYQYGKHQGQQAFNCIVYPGEEGAFLFQTNSNRGNMGYELLEDFQEYSGQLGIWYSYDGHFEVRNDLPLNLHPKVENITFERDQAQLKFQFDVIDIPKSQTKVNRADLVAWVILYNRDGNISNILYRRLNELHGFSWQQPSVHIRGNSVDTAGEYLFYRPIEMTQQMIDAVERIDVFVEFVEGNICSSGEY